MLITATYYNFTEPMEGCNITNPSELPNADCGYVRVIVTENDKQIDGGIITLDSDYNAITPANRDTVITEAKKEYKEKWNPTLSKQEQLAQKEKEQAQAERKFILEFVKTRKTSASGAELTAINELEQSHTEVETLEREIEREQSSQSSGEQSSEGES